MIYLNNFYINQYYKEEKDMLMYLNNLDQYFIQMVNYQLIFYLDLYYLSNK